MIVGDTVGGTVGVVGVVVGGVGVVVGVVGVVVGVVGVVVGVVGVVVEVVGGVAGSVVPPGTLMVMHPAVRSRARVAVKSENRRVVLLIGPPPWTYSDGSPDSGDSHHM